MLPPADDHEWLSLHDDDGATWLFDLTHLRSNYRCIYGAGCPSIEPDPDPTGTIGCCSHGAHLLDDDDRNRVAARAAQLGPDEWQFRGRARSGPFKQLRNGDWMTRLSGGACVFLNRDGFAGGTGCALHGAAVRRGERPLDWKPSVCWQVPIRLDVHEDDYGHQTTLVRAWQRRDWGPGGDDFHWWCIEEADAYVGAVPVYIDARDELLELVGEALYLRLVEVIEARTGQTGSGPRATPTPVTVRPGRRKSG